MQDIAELDVNAKPIEANGNGSDNHEVTTHYKKNVHSTLCGLNSSFHVGAATTSKTSETTCRKTA